VKQSLLINCFWLFIIYNIVIYYNLAIHEYNFKFI
jgi:uncharacterized protein YhhL (DUF1145 family)